MHGFDMRGTLYRQDIGTDGPIRPPISQSRCATRNRRRTRGPNGRGRWPDRIPEPPPATSCTTA